MIEQYTGTIGSGKTYHALERIVEHLKQGKYVIANFPMTFPPGMVRKGYADRFLYLPAEHLEDESGIAVFVDLAEKYGFDEFKNLCLVVLDEAGDIFPPHQSTSELQRLWKSFFKFSRHLGYDFILIMQDETEINRTIARCMEYKVVHRKANNIFPFNLLPFTLFMHITYWKQSRQRLKSGSTIFVKAFSRLYNTHQYRGAVKTKMPDIDLTKYDFKFEFGNCRPADPEADGVGGQPVGGAQPVGTGSDEDQAEIDYEEESA